MRVSCEQNKDHAVDGTLVIYGNSNSHQTFEQHYFFDPEKHKMKWVIKSDKNYIVLKATKVMARLYFMRTTQGS